MGRDYATRHGPEISQEGPALHLQLRESLGDFWFAICFSRFETEHRHPAHPAVP